MLWAAAESPLRTGDTEWPDECGNVGDTLGGSKSVENQAYALRKMCL